MIEYYIISELNSNKSYRLHLTTKILINLFQVTNFFLLWPVYNNFLAILNNLKTIGCTI